MSVDVREQILNEIKLSPLFAFQFRKFEFAFACLCEIYSFRWYQNEFLFCSELETTTKSEYIKVKLNTLSYTGELKFTHLAYVTFEHCIGVCLRLMFIYIYGKFKQVL